MSVSGQDKAATAYRTISEVADALELPQHVLRFWESRFPQIKPRKGPGGRRYYRPADIDLLRRIRKLLYEDGFTIRGAQLALRDHSGGGPAAAVAEATESQSDESQSAESPSSEIFKPVAPVQGSLFLGERPAPPKISPPAAGAGGGRTGNQQTELRRALQELREIRRTLKV